MRNQRWRNTMERYRDSHECYAQWITRLYCRVPDVYKHRKYIISRLIHVLRQITFPLGSNIDDVYWSNILRRYKSVDMFPTSSSVVPGFFVLWECFLAHLKIKLSCEIHGHTTWLCTNVNTRVSFFARQKLTKIVLYTSPA